MLGLSYRLKELLAHWCMVCLTGYTLYLVDKQLTFMSQIYLVKVHKNEKLC